MPGSRGGPGTGRSGASIRHSQLVLGGAESPTPLPEIAFRSVWPGLSTRHEPCVEKSAEEKVASQAGRGPPPRSSLRRPVDQQKALARF